jgi:Cd(II)/Pb(II)-responsive transcriptional regulator
MRIGQLAVAAGANVETIRYYERQGLLPAPMRSSSGYRIYASAHLERLAFIRHCRSLDIALDEIRALLRIKDARGVDCHEVDSVLDAHIAHVAERIRELRGLERQLRALRRRCRQAREVAHCGILAELARPTAGARTASRAGAAQHVRGPHASRRAARH